MTSKLIKSDFIKIKEITEEEAKSLPIRRKLKLHCGYWAYIEYRNISHKEKKTIRSNRFYTISTHSDQLNKYLFKRDRRYYLLTQDYPCYNKHLERYMTHTIYNTEPCKKYARINLVDAINLNKKMFRITIHNPFDDTRQMDWYYHPIDVGVTADTRKLMEEILKYKHRCPEETFNLKIAYEDL